MGRASSVRGGCRVVFWAFHGPDHGAARGQGESGAWPISWRLAVRVTRSIDLAVAPQPALAIVRAALEGGNWIRTFEIDEAAGRAIARTGISWKTWGAKITLQV